MRRSTRHQRFSPNEQERRKPRSLETRKLDPCERHFWRPDRNRTGSAIGLVGRKFGVVVRLCVCVSCLVFGVFFWLIMISTGRLARKSNDRRRAQPAERCGQLISERSGAMRKKLSSHLFWLARARARERQAPDLIMRSKVNDNTDNNNRHLHYNARLVLVGAICCCSSSLRAAANVGRSVWLRVLIGELGRPSSWSDSNEQQQQQQQFESAQQAGARMSRRVSQAKDRNHS